MEQGCYGSSASKPVYLSKLAHCSMEAKLLSSSAELLAKASRGTAPAVQQAEAASPSEQKVHTASGQSLRPSANGKEEDSVGRSLQQMCFAIEECMSGEGPLEPGAEKAVLDKLGMMRGAPVTTALLRETGIGHKLKALSKGPDKIVAAAAKGVIAAWKVTICKETS